MTDHEPTNETALIRRAQVLRDRNAFGALVELHQSRVRSFLLRLCRDYDLADDLSQETFMQAHKHLNTFRPLGAFSSWLFKIAYNCFLQECRRTKRSAEVLSAYGHQQEIEEQRYTSISAREVALETAMQKLSVDEAACISLCYSFGHSHSEAVHILEMPLGTIKSHINRGKEKLKQLLAPSPPHVTDQQQVQSNE